MLPKYWPIIAWVFPKISKTPSFRYSIGRMKRPGTYGNCYRLHPRGWNLIIWKNSSRTTPPTSKNRSNPGSSCSEMTSYFSNMSFTGGLSNHPFLLLPKLPPIKAFLTYCWKSQTLKHCVSFTMQRYLIGLSYGLLLSKILSF